MEVQHGHIYSLHIGYLKPLQSETALLPDHILLWSEYYRRTLVRNRWNSSEIKVTGDYSSIDDMTESEPHTLPQSLISFIARFEVIITIVGQHSINEVFLEYLKSLRMIPENAGIIFKFHPKYADAQKSFF